MVDEKKNEVAAYPSDFEPFDPRNPPAAADPSVDNLGINIVTRKLPSIDEQLPVTNNQLSVDKPVETVDNSQKIYDKKAKGKERKKEPKKERNQKKSKAKRAIDAQLTINRSLVTRKKREHKKGAGSKKEKIPKQPQTHVGALAEKSNPSPLASIPSGVSADRALSAIPADVIAEGMEIVARQIRLLKSVSDQQMILSAKETGTLARLMGIAIDAAAITELGAAGLLNVRKMSMAAMFEYLSDFIKSWPSESAEPSAIDVTAGNPGTTGDAPVRSTDGS